MLMIVDKALEKRAAEGRPIRVAVMGAGYLGRYIASLMVRQFPGMALSCVVNRTVSKAEEAYRNAGIDAIRRVSSAQDLEDAVDRGDAAVTDDPEVACCAGNIDAVIEVTGDIDYGAQVSVSAIKNGKHLILQNAELDATVGPLLHQRAEANGVVYTNADGDQPAVLMNLLRYVRTVGFRPVLAGNIKGMIDHYRTPDTQKAYAEKYGLTPQMACNFADGTKISMENAIVANATGFPAGRRGMYGPTCEHVGEAADLFPLDKMLKTGLVDYILGAEPSPGVFVLGYSEDPVQQHYMYHFKMGKGPIFVFYAPYHFPHLDAPITVARAVLFQDAAIAPIGGPVCDVVATAKRDLKAGEVLDGIGGFTCYGVIENCQASRAEGLLPMGLSHDCRLLRDIPKDAAISYADVERPQGRLSDRLRAEQDAGFPL